MKRLIDCKCRAGRAVAAGFTLVELLVVILIIGLLAGLVTPAVIKARTAAKNAAIKVEINQLEMACQAYKQKFGEYPPDFTDPNAVRRHLSKAFPRYDNTNWQNDLHTKNPSIDVGNLTPQTALVFWLGGLPDADGLPSGFAANPLDPFAPPPGFPSYQAGVTPCTSRIASFFEFDSTRLSKPVGGVVTYKYWPQGAAGEMAPDTAITYFRAENGNYTINGQTLAANLSNAKYYPMTGPIASSIVLPAIDTRLSKASVKYVSMNPKSFQILCAGLDVLYSRPLPNMYWYNGTADKIGPYLYPSGENYDAFTQDDITNFSDGTMGNSIP